jgi:neutral ceramidase
VLGFNKQSYQAIVDGCIQSVKNAQASLTKGTLTVGTGTVQDGNINRSQWAYLANPQAERDSYASSTDTTMTVLGFKRSSDGKNMGMLTWYPVHGTSAYNNNTYVTGDNKGVAATMTEQAYAQDANSAPGFVAAYSQANVGDTSPRVLGQWCDDGSG